MVLFKWISQIPLNTQVNTIILYYDVDVIVANEDTLVEFSDSQTLTSTLILEEVTGQAFFLNNHISIQLLKVAPVRGFVLVRQVTLNM